MEFFRIRHDIPFMSHALKDKPAIPFRTPPGIRLVRVDASTGRPTSASNPRLILEAFKPGTAPPSPGEGASRSGGSGASAAPATGTGGLY